MDLSMEEIEFQDIGDEMDSYKEDDVSDIMNQWRVNSIVEEPFVVEDDIHSIVNNWKKPSVQKRSPNGRAEKNVQNLNTNVTSAPQSPSSQDVPRESSPASNSMFEQSVNLGRQQSEDSIIGTPERNFKAKEASFYEGLESHYARDLFVDRQLKRVEKLKALRKQLATGKRPFDTEKVKRAIQTVEQEYEYSNKYFLKNVFNSRDLYNRLNQDEMKAINLLYVDLAFIDFLVDRCLDAKEGDHEKDFKMIAAYKKDAVMKIANLKSSKNELVHKTVRDALFQFDMENIRLDSIGAEQLVKAIARTRPKEMPPMPPKTPVQVRRDKNAAVCMDHQRMVNEIEAIREKQAAGKSISTDERDKLLKFTKLEWTMVTSNMPSMAHTIGLLSKKNQTIMIDFFVRFLLITNDIELAIQGSGNRVQLENNIDNNAEAILYMMRTNPTLTTYMTQIQSHFGFERYNLNTMSAATLIATIAKIRAPEPATKSETPKVKAPISKEELKARNETFCTEYKIKIKEIENIQKKNMVRKVTSATDAQKIREFDQMVIDIIVDNMPKLEPNIKTMEATELKNFKTLCISVLQLFDAVKKVDSVKKDEEKRPVMIEIKKLMQQIASIIKKYPNNASLALVMSHFGLDRFRLDGMEPTQLIQKLRTKPKPVQTKLPKPSLAPKETKVTKPKFVDTEWILGGQLNDEEIKEKNVKFCRDHEITSKYVAELEMYDDDATEAEQAIYGLEKKMFLVNWPKLVKETKQLPFEHSRLVVRLAVRFVLLMNAIQQCLEGSPNEQLLLGQIDMYAHDINEVMKVRDRKVTSLANWIACRYGFEDVNMVEGGPEALIDLVKRKQDEEAFQARLAKPFKEHVPIGASQLQAKNARFCVEHNKLETEISDLQNQYGGTIRRVPKLAEKQTELEAMEKSIVVDNLPEMMTEIESRHVDHQYAMVKLAVNYLHIIDTINECLADEDIYAKEQLRDYIENVNNIIYDNAEINDILCDISNRFGFTYVMNPEKVEELLDHFELQRETQGIAIDRKPYKVNNFIATHLPQLVPKLEKLPNRHRRVIVTFVDLLRDLRLNIDNIILRKVDDTNTALKRMVDTIGTIEKLESRHMSLDLKTILKQFGLKDCFKYRTKPKELVELAENHMLPKSIWPNVVKPAVPVVEQEMEEQTAESEEEEQEEPEEAAEDDNAGKMAQAAALARVESLENLWADNQAFCKKEQVLSKTVAAINKKNMGKLKISPEDVEQIKRLEKMADNVIAKNLPHLKSDIDQLIASNLNIFRTFCVHFLHLVNGVYLPDTREDGSENKEKISDIVSNAKTLSNMLKKHTKINDILMKVVRHFGFNKFDYASLTEENVPQLVRAIEQQRSTDMKNAKKVEISSNVAPGAPGKKGESRKVYAPTGKALETRELLLRHRPIEIAIADVLEGKKIKVTKKDEQNVAEFNALTSKLFELNFSHYKDEIDKLNSSNRNTFIRFCATVLHLLDCIEERVQTEGGDQNEKNNEEIGKRALKITIDKKFVAIRPHMEKLLKERGIDPKLFVFTEQLTKSQINHFIATILEARQKTLIPAKTKTKTIPKKVVEKGVEVTWRKYDPENPTYRPYPDPQHIIPMDELYELNKLFCEENDSVINDIETLKSKRKTKHIVPQNEQDLIDYWTNNQNDIILTNFPQIEADFQKLNSSNKKNFREFALCFVYLFDAVDRIMNNEEAEPQKLHPIIEKQYQLVPKIEKKYPNNKLLHAKILKHYGFNTFNYDKEMTATAFIEKITPIRNAMKAPKTPKKEPRAEPQTAQKARTARKSRTAKEVQHVEELPDTSPLEISLQQFTDEEVKSFNEQLCSDIRLVLRRIADYEVTDLNKFAPQIAEEKADLYKLQKKLVGANVPTQVEHIAAMSAVNRRKMVRFTGGLVLLLDAIEKCIEGHEPTVFLKEIADISEDIQTSIATTPEAGLLMEQIAAHFGFPELEDLEKSPTALVQYTRMLQDNRLNKSHLSLSFGHASQPDRSTLRAQNERFCNDLDRLETQLIRAKIDYGKTLKRLPQLQQTQKQIRDLEKRILAANVTGPSKLMLKALSQDQQKIVYKLCIMFVRLRNVIAKSIDGDFSLFGEIEKQLEHISEFIDQYPEIEEPAQLIVKHFLFVDTNLNTIGGKELVEQVARYTKPYYDIPVDEYLLMYLPHLLEPFSKLSLIDRELVNKLAKDIQQLHTKLELCLDPSGTTNRSEEIQDIDILLVEISRIIRKEHSVRDFGDGLLESYGLNTWNLADMTAERLIAILDKDRRPARQQLQDQYQSYEQYLQDEEALRAQTEENFQNWYKNKKTHDIEHEAELQAVINAAIQEQNKYNRDTVEQYLTLAEQLANKLAVGEETTDIRMQLDKLSDALLNRNIPKTLSMLAKKKIQLDVAARDYALFMMLLKVTIEITWHDLDSEQTAKMYEKVADFLKHLTKAEQQNPVEENTTLHQIFTSIKKELGVDEMFAKALTATQFIDRYRSIFFEGRAAVIRLLTKISTMCDELSTGSRYTTTCSPLEFVAMSRVLAGILETNQVKATPVQTPEEKKYSAQE